MDRPVITRLTSDGLSTRSHSVAHPTSSAGPTFILVHGIGMSQRYFLRLQERLAEVGDVHSVELPGFGGNKRPRRDMSVAATADILASLIDAVGASSCVVVGHSMGAQFVVELSIRRPDLVSHLVLIGPVVDPAHPSALQQAARLALDTLRETPRINAIVFTDYLRCGVRWYANQLRPMLTYPIEDRIGSVDRPVLVLRGSNDPVASRAWCISLAAHARDGSSASIPGGAHVIQYSRPAGVSAAILSFAITEIEAGS